MQTKAGLLFAIALSISPASFPGYAIYIGKNLTADGSVLLGGSGDEVVPAQDHPAGTTITVGVTSEAIMPGAFTEIPQVRHTFCCR